MTWLNSHPLTFLVFAPALLGLLLLALPHTLGKLARVLGLLGALAVFFCSPAGDQVRGVAWNMDGGWAAQ